MQIINKAVVDELFRREAVMLGREDCVPEHRAAALFGKEAVKHAKSFGAGKYWNMYGIGDFQMEYLTYLGFQAAASYSNVFHLRKEAEKYEKEARG